MEGMEAAAGRADGGDEGVVQENGLRAFLTPCRASYSVMPVT